MNAAGPQKPSYEEAKREIVDKKIELQQKAQQSALRPLSIVCSISKTDRMCDSFRVSTEAAAEKNENASNDSHMQDKARQTVVQMADADTVASNIHAKPAD